MKEVFLDSAYAIALSAPNDQYHERALQLAEQLERDVTRLIITRAVLLEIENTLAKQKYCKNAVVRSKDFSF